MKALAIIPLLACALPAASVQSATDTPAFYPELELRVGGLERLSLTVGDTTSAVSAISPIAGGKLAISWSRVVSTSNGDVALRGQQVDPLAFWPTHCVTRSGKTAGEVFCAGTSSRGFTVIQKRVYLEPGTNYDPNAPSSKKELLDAKLKSVENLYIAPFGTSGAIRWFAIDPRDSGYVIAHLNGDGALKRINLSDGSEVTLASTATHPCLSMVVTRPTIMRGVDGSTHYLVETSGVVIDPNITVAERERILRLVDQDGDGGLDIIDDIGPLELETLGYDNLSLWEY